MDKPKFKPYPDGGSLRATKVKKSPKSSDYWGEIAVNLNDTTNFRTEDGLTIIKLGGWKKVDSQGNTYLSLAVDRFVPINTSAPAPQKKASADFDDDIPF